MRDMIKVFLMINKDSTDVLAFVKGISLFFTDIIANS